MLTDDISNASKAGVVSISTMDSGEIGKYDFIAPGEIKGRIQVSDVLDHLKAPKYNQLQESVVQGASQENEVARIEGHGGWFSCLKRAIVMKKPASHTEKAENVKPRRRGFYTFLYGARVNVDTFYDYKDQL